MGDDTKEWRIRYSDMNRHWWAFYYFCKRKGDQCMVGTDPETGEKVVIIRVGEKPRAFRKLTQESERLGLDY